MNGYEPARLLGAKTQEGNPVVCTLLGNNKLANKSLQGVQPQLWTTWQQDADVHHTLAAACRGVQVLDVCDVALDLHHPTSPTNVDPVALAAAARASGQQALVAAAGAGASVSTPRGGQQQQQQGITPRQQVHGHSLADALAEARTK
jgi:hypothetical protein